MKIPFTDIQLFPLLSDSIHARSPLNEVSQFPPIFFVTAQVEGTAGGQSSSQCQLSVSNKTQTRSRHFTYFVFPNRSVKHLIKRNTEEYVCSVPSFILKSRGNSSHKLFHINLTDRNSNCYYLSCTRAAKPIFSLVFCNPLNTATKRYNSSTKHYTCSINNPTLCPSIPLEKSYPPSSPKKDTN